MATVTVKSPLFGGWGRGQSWEGDFMEDLSPLGIIFSS